ncbi:MAG: hypothetical protein HOH95_06590 [Dehalococcoidia bacterium]|nr:hypothetical protein [Dehalococcoidia bacterium]
MIRRTPSQSTMSTQTFAPGWGEPADALLVQGIVGHGRRPARSGGDRAR